MQLSSSTRFVCFCCVALLVHTANLYAEASRVTIGGCPPSAQSGALEVDLWREVKSAASPHHLHVSTGCLLLDPGGYWKLEVCPGRWIRQLRVDDNVVTQQNIMGVQSRWSLTDETGTSLVQFGSGLATVPDIIRQTTAAKSAIRKVGRGGTASDDVAWRRLSNGYSCDITVSGFVVRARYENGAVCEATGQPRSTVLELVCDDSLDEPRVHVREPVVCQYWVTLTARQVCMLIGLDRDLDQHALNVRFGVRDEDIRLST